MTLDQKTADLMVTDFLAWEASLDDRGKQIMERMFKFEVDRDAAARRFASVSAVAAYTGHNVEDVSRRWEDWYMPAFARDERVGFGLREGVADSNQFFDILKTRATDNNHRRDLLSNEVDAAYSAALLNDRDGFKTWLESARSHPGYKIENEDKYLDAWQAVKTKVDSELGDVGPTLRLAIKRMGVDMGVTEETQATREAYYIHPERYLGELAANNPTAYKHAKQMLVKLAERAPKEDKSGVLGWLQKLGESFYRGSENLIGGAFEGTQDVSATLADAMGNSAGAAAIRGRNQVARDIRAIGSGTYDPVQANDDFDRAAFVIAESVPGMFAAMTPAPRFWTAGRLLLAGSFTGSAVQDFTENGWTGPGAEIAAVGVGVLSTGVETASEYLSKIPGVSHALTALGVKPGSLWLTRFVLNTAGRYPTEIAEEGVQDMMAPAVQAVLSAFDVVAARDKTFMEEWQSWKENQLPTVALVALPLAALGAAVVSSGEIGVAKVNALTADKVELARLFGEERATAIAAEPDGRRRVGMIQQTWEQQTKEERLERLKVQQELQSLLQMQEAASTAEAESYTVNVTRGANGWRVTRGDGTVVNVTTAEAARRVREGLKQVATQEEAEALADVLDDWHSIAPAGTTRETTFSGNVVSSDGASIVQTRDGRVVREITDKRSLEVLRAEAALEAAAGGNSDVDVLVNGSNEHFLVKVAETVKEIAQKLDLHQSNIPQVMTFLHEALESSWRVGMETGRFTEGGTRKAAAVIAESLRDVQPRSTEEQKLFVSLGRIAAGKGSETELRETIVELAVRDVIERDRNGRRTGFRAGSITRALDSAVLSAANAEDARAFSKVRAFFRSVGAWLRGVLGTVRVLKAAKDSGRIKAGDDWSVFVDKLLGLDEQVKYEAELAAELEAIANQDSLTATEPTAEEKEAGMAFSLSAGARLAEVQAALDKRLAKDPEARQKIGLEAKRRLQGLKDRWETERWTWQGDRIRPIADKASSRQLDHERAFRQAFRDAELVEAGLATLSPETIQAYHEGVGTMERHPLIWAMIQNNGRLMSKTSAMAQGKQIGGDYDGAVWLPPSWYSRGAGLTPDVMAQNLYEQGLLSEPSTDVLWAALDSVVKSHRAAKAEFSKAATAVREIEQKAAEQARAELQVWRDERGAMQAKDWSPRAALVRDMKTLDAMLSALPAEVRGRVGGFVKLAQLGTEKSRLEEIQRRVERLDILLEKHLQKELKERIETLFERARPERKSGKAPKSKMTAEASRLVEMAERYSAVLEADMDGERKKITDRLAAPDANLAELSEQSQVLEMFGGMDRANAASLAEAADWLANIITTGKNIWRLQKEMKRMDQQANAVSLKRDTGKKGELAELQDGLDQEKTIKREAGGWAFNLVSFEQLMNAVFGADSEVGKRLVEWARSASFARTDAIRAKRQDWQAAMQGIWKGKSWGDVQEALWDHSQLSSPVAMTVNHRTGRTETKVEVPMEIALRVVADPKQAKALGFTTEEVLQLESLIDENDLRPERNQVEKLEISRLSAGKATPVKLSQFQAVNLTMLARQRDYQDTLTYHGWTTDVIAEIEGKLTGEAKAVRQWLADQYRQGYGSLNEVFKRMFGVSLPQIDHYSPGTWEGMLMGVEMSPDGFSAMGAGGISPGPLKTRRVHRASPRLADAMVEYWKHVSTTEHFKAFAEFVTEAQATLLRPEVRFSIKERGGEEALNAITTWMKVFENDGIRRSASLDNLERFNSRLQSVVSVSALAWNVGTLAKQSLATLGAAYEMPTGAYLSGFSRLMRGKLEFREMLQSEIIRRRVEAGASPELRQVMAGWMGSHPGKLTRGPRWFVQRGMDLLGETDGFFTAASAAIYYDYSLKQAQEAGMPEAMAKAEALKKTEAMVARTAQPVELMDRSLYEAKAAANPNQRWLFMFASESRQKAAIYGMSLGRILKGKATAQDWRVMVISHVVAPMVLQTITNFISDWRDDDDRELFDMEHWSPLRYLKAALMGPLSGVPLLSGVVNTVLSQATGQSSWDSDPTNPIGELIGRTVSGIKASQKETEQEPVEKGVNATKAALNAVAAVSALSPVGQPLGWIGAAGNVLDQIFDVVDNATGTERKKKKSRD